MKTAFPVDKFDLNGFIQKRAQKLKSLAMV